ncbi:hypothetical protein EMCRGX_G024096 [Ephydatia muelleri]
MGDKENQTSAQGQQDATSSHHQHSQGQQDATSSHHQHSQGQRDSTATNQQKGTEVTLENLKWVMRSVAREVFEEHRGQRQQGESSLQSGTTVGKKHPDMTPELLAYMLHILRAYREYEEPAWREYDVRFRQQAAVSGNRAWAQLDPQLYNQCFVGRARRAANPQVSEAAEMAQRPARAEQKAGVGGKAKTDVNSTSGCDVFTYLRQPFRDGQGYGVGAFTDQLLALNRCTPLIPNKGPAELQNISTPLKAEEWEKALVGHPDEDLVAYIVSGIQTGFRVGFDYAKQRCISARANLPSAAENQEVVTAYLKEECAQGRVIRMGPAETVVGLQISPFGVIPKGQTGKWRLIVDLSSPHGGSVNDGIDSELCSLSYVSVEDVASIILRLGRGTLMAKVDIKSAYRLLPVHPEDRLLLGMEWQGLAYIDTTLPFGLRSAPKIFTAVADMLEWVFQNRGVKHVRHYLDDFILLGPTHNDTCQKGLDVVLETCECLGVPLALEKLEGPTTCLTFLGIEIDTITLELRLPEAKLQAVRTAAKAWYGRRSGTKRELLSLIGVLGHACKVVRPGKRFLRRLINLSNCTRQLNRHIRLNMECRSDLGWWYIFLPQWNGVSMMWDDRKKHPDQMVWSNASGSWGCGAYWHTRWFQYPWTEVSTEWSIAVKEMVPVMWGCFVWGSEWVRGVVQWSCDNLAVVEVINRGCSKDEHLAHLLRCIHFAEAKFNFTLVARHVEGVANDKADDLSRNRLSSFLSKVSEADDRPTQIPPWLEQLGAVTGEWTNKTWNRYLTFCSEDHVQPLPTNEETLCKFVAWLFVQGLSHQTMKSYLSAVRHLQITSGVGDPFASEMPKLQYVLKGARIERSRITPGARHIRLPITPDIMLKIKEVLNWNSAEFDNIMLWAAACACYFGFLRSGEITVPALSAYCPESHLGIKDVSVDQPGRPEIIHLTLKASKTDPFRKGVVISLGRTGKALCPVVALLTYLAVRKGHDTGPLFQLKDGRPLTKPAFVDRIKETLTKAGIDRSSYAGHSFRIGAATSAAAAGVEDSMIQTLGRWKSSAYLVYVRVPRERLAAISTRLAG